MKSLLALVFCSAVALAGVAPPATAPSNTRFASRDLRISWGQFQVSPDNLSDVLDHAATALGPQVLGIQPEKLSDSFRYSWETGAHQVTLRLRATVPVDATPAAKEFLDQMVDESRKWAVMQFNEEREQQLRPLIQARDEAQQRLDVTTANARDIHAQIGKLAGRADVTPSTITAALTKMEDEKQKLELDLMAKRARAEATEQQIARRSEQIQKTVDSDAIVVELQKVVDARQQKVDLVKRQATQGAASASEVSEAVASAAEARAKLLERKRDAAAEAGGTALEGFNRELMTLSVDLRELEARLKFVESHLPGLREAMDRLDALGRAEAELAGARNEFDAADVRLRKGARAVSAAKAPTVVVTKHQNLEQPPAPSNAEN